MVQYLKVLFLRSWTSHWFHYFILGSLIAFRNCVNRTWVRAGCLMTESYQIFCSHVGRNAYHTLIGVLRSLVIFIIFVIVINLYVFVIFLYSGFSSARKWTSVRYNIMSIFIINMRGADSADGRNSYSFLPFLFFVARFKAKKKTSFLKQTVAIWTDKK